VGLNLDFIPAKMMNRFMNRPVGTQNRRQNQDNRINHAIHQVNKIVPFQVRRNKQMMSIPSHRETGLNIERVFRTQTKVNTGSGIFSLDFAFVAKLILSELSIATTVDPFDITLKEIRVYANTPISARFAYRVGTQADRTTTFSDYCSFAGLSSVCVVYPVASRLSFASNSTSSTLVVQAESPPPIADVDTFVVVDILARVSSRGDTIDPLPIPPP
jgi:hypothetical protein